MKKIILIIFALCVILLPAGDRYDNYCKEHPFDKKCITEALGGKDNIKKERT